MGRAPAATCTLTILLLVFALSSPVARSQEEANRTLDTANGLLNRGLYELAIPEYRSYLREYPDGAEANAARYALGVCLYQGALYTQAISALDEIPAGASFPFAFEADLIRADCLCRLDRFPEAIKALTALLSSSSDHASAPKAAALLGEALSRAGEHASAVDVADQTLARWPDAPERNRVELFRALSLVDLGKQDEAQRGLQSLIARKPDPSIERPALMTLARSLHASGDLVGAERRYREVLERGADEDRPGALLGLGRVCREQHNQGEARRHFETLIEAFPDDPRLASARMELALVCVDQEQYDEAQELAERVLASGETSLHPTAAYWIGKAAMGAHRNAEAAKALAHALDRYPDSPLAPQIAYDLGIAQIRSGDKASGARTLARFRARHPDHELVPDALHAEAIVALEGADYAKARALTTRLLGAHPDHSSAPDAMFILGEASYLDGEYDDAVRAFKAVLERAPNGQRAMRARYRLGMSLYRQGHAEQARPHLESAVREDPVPGEFRPALAALGEIEFDAERWDRARAHLERFVRSAAESGPRIEGALLRLGLSFSHERHHRDALEWFGALIERAPDSPEAAQARFERARTLIELGRSDDAVADLLGVANASPPSRFAPHAQRLLGELAIERGDTKEAERRFASAAESKDTDVALAARYDQARAKLEAGDAPGALASLDRLLAQKNLPGVLHDHAAAARAIALSRLDRHEPALEAIDGLDVDALDPQTRRTIIFERASCFAAVGRTSDARKDLDTLRGTGTPNDDIGRHALLMAAGIEMDAERYSRAADLLDELLSDAPRAGADVLEVARYRRGLCARELADHEGVAEAFATFRADFPRSELAPSADLFCAEALIALNRRLDAIEHLKAAADSGSPEDVRASALMRLGALHAALQQWTPSRAAYEAFLDAYPHHEQRFRALFGIGWALENEGDHERAIEAYRTVIDEHTGETAARAQFQIGECLFAMNRPEQAVRELLRVEILYAYPDWSAAALYEAGRCFEAMNKIGEARAQYRRVTDEFAKTKWADAASERLDQLRSAGLPARGGD